MKKIKIDSLAKLEAFISDESINIENRFEVFTQATKGYPFIVLVIRNGEGGKIKEPSKILSEMKRVIGELNTTPENVAGFMLMLK